jgi:hypothetical protein
VENLHACSGGQPIDEGAILHHGPRLHCFASAAMLHATLPGRHIHAMRSPVRVVPPQPSIAIAKRADIHRCPSPAIGALELLLTGKTRHLSPFFATAKLPFSFCYNHASCTAGGASHVSGRGPPRLGRPRIPTGGSTFSLPWRPPFLSCGGDGGASHASVALPTTAARASATLGHGEPTLSRFVSEERDGGGSSPRRWSQWLWKIELVGEVLW